MEELDRRLLNQARWLVAETTPSGGRTVSEAGLPASTLAFLEHVGGVFVIARPVPGAKEPLVAFRADNEHDAASYLIYAAASSLLQTLLPDARVKCSKSGIYSIRVRFGDLIPELRLTAHAISGERWAVRGHMLSVTYETSEGGTESVEMPLFEAHARNPRDLAKKIQAGLTR